MVSKALENIMGCALHGFPNSYFVIETCTCVLTFVAILTMVGQGGLATYFWVYGKDAVIHVWRMAVSWEHSCSEACLLLLEAFMPRLEPQFYFIFW